MPRKKDKKKSKSVTPSTSNDNLSDCSDSSLLYCKKCDKNYYYAYCICPDCHPSSHGLIPPDDSESEEEEEHNPEFCRCQMRWRPDGPQMCDDCRRVLDKRDKCFGCRHHCIGQGDHMGPGGCLENAAEEELS